MKHSKIGGSVAKRIINCPGSVALCQQMPPKSSSSYADEGTLCHTAMDMLLSGKVKNPEDVIGLEYQGIVLTEDLYDEKIAPALEMFEVLERELDLEYVCEARVEYPRIPGAFGTSDIIGYAHKVKRATVLDWKFGEGVLVPAEESEQLLYYAGAARETDSTKWAFEHAEGLECIIIQPAVCDKPMRWVTSLKRLDQFVVILAAAAAQSERDDALVRHGSWCKWCAAKPICPVLTGEVDRALATKIESVDAKALGAMLERAELVEAWVASVQALVFDVLDAGKAVPGYKLVAKQGRRKWVDEPRTRAALRNIGCEENEYLTEPELKSPAQVEKILKKSKMELPEGLTITASSGNTVAPESDPRPAVVQIGKQLTAALSKLA